MSRRSQRTRGGVNSRRGRLAFLLPRPGEPRQELARGTSIPVLNTRPPHLAPTCSAWRVARERGAARNPRLGGRSNDSGPSPQAERKGQPGSGLLPTHLSCGPVFGSGSSGVRVAATKSPRLPRPIPPAAAQQRLLTAHARAAARGASRAHLLGGAQRPRRGAAPRAGVTAAGARREAPVLPRAAPPRPALVRWARLQGWRGGVSSSLVFPGLFFLPIACPLCKQWGSASYCT